MNWSLGAAFSMGLLGSIHCVGMCGSMIMAVGGALDSKPGLDPLRKIPTHVAYHLGRLITYTSLGIAAGAGGHFINMLAANTGFPYAAMIFSIMILVGVAFHLLGVAPSYEPGKRSTFSDIMGRILQEVSGIPGAFLLGIVTGYLPCGLLYGALALAVAAGSPFGGGAVMAMFWAGTVPLLLVIGQSGRILMKRLRGNVVIATGLLILSIAIGILALQFIAFDPGAKKHGSQTPAAQHSTPVHSH